MSSVNVDYEDLVTFKSTLERNAAHFDEICKSIGDNINFILETDWQDQESEKFSQAFFERSVPDIDSLVETMMAFSTYLQTKIEVLQQYLSTNINF